MVFLSNAKIAKNIGEHNIKPTANKGDLLNTFAIDKLNLIEK